MAISPTQIDQIKPVLDNAKEIYLIFPSGASLDIVASSLALFSGLQAQGKTVYLATPEDISPEAHRLPGSDQITYKIGNRNLVITLKVNSRDSIDKVSYNLDEDKSEFNLIIQPKKGQPPLKSSDVNFSYSGVQAEAVILIGASRFEDFTSFYAAEPKLFTDSTTISLHRYTTQKFATIHLDDTRANSLAEITHQTMQALGLKLTPASASTLLAAIDQTTNQLTSSTASADTFEIVAQLLRAGGQRRLLETDASSPAPNPTPLTPSTAPVPQEWLQPKILKSGQPGPADASVSKV